MSVQCLNRVSCLHMRKRGIMLFPHILVRQTLLLFGGFSWTKASISGMLLMGIANVGDDIEEV